MRRLQLPFRLRRPQAKAPSPPTAQLEVVRLESRALLNADLGGAAPGNVTSRGAGGQPSLPAVSELVPPAKAGSDRIPVARVDLAAAQVEWQTVESPRPDRLVHRTESAARPATSPVPATGSPAPSPALTASRSVPRNESLPDSESSPDSESEPGNESKPGNEWTPDTTERVEPDESRSPGDDRTGNSGLEALAEQQVGGDVNDADNGAARTTVASPLPTTLDSSDQASDGLPTTTTTPSDSHAPTKTDRQTHCESADRLAAADGLCPILVDQAAGVNADGDQDEPLEPTTSEPTTADPGGPARVLPPAPGALLVATLGQPLTRLATPHDAARQAGPVAPLKTASAPARSGRRRRSRSSGREVRGAERQPSHAFPPIPAAEVDLALANYLGQPETPPITSPSVPSPNAAPRPRSNTAQLMPLLLTLSLAAGAVGSSWLAWSRLRRSRAFRALRSTAAFSDAPTQQ